MQLVRFDTTTGVVTVIGQITNFGLTQFGAGGLTFDNTRTLYAPFAADDPSCSTSGQFFLYRVDPNAAAATFVGTSPFEQTVVQGLAGAC